MYDECSSTQDIAKEIAHNSENGVCIVALHQTKGRGRLGRKWFSPEGGLWLSIIVKSLPDPMFLNPIFAVSAIEVIEQLYQLRAKIYWPNDIYVEESQKSKSAELTAVVKSHKLKKVGGILTEGIHSESSVYIGGIGINMNIEKQYFDEHNLDYATSLYIESGEKVGILDFLQNFLIKFNFLYELIQVQSCEYIDSAFKKYNGLLSRYVKIKHRKDEYIGQVIDMSIKDGILLKLKNNIVKSFNAEVVENVREVDYAEIL